MWPGGRVRRPCIKDSVEYRSIQTIIKTCVCASVVGMQATCLQCLMLVRRVIDVAKSQPQHGLQKHFQDFPHPVASCRKKSRTDSCGLDDSG